MSSIFFHHRPTSVCSKKVEYFLNLPLYKDDLPELVKMAMAEMKPGTIMVTAYGELRFDRTGEYATLTRDFKMAEHIEADRAEQLPRRILKKYVTDILKPYIAEGVVRIDKLHIK